MLILSGFTLFQALKMSRMAWYTLLGSMLVIRAQQMKVFNEAMERAFERRAVDHINARFGESELHISRVRRGIRSALALGLNDESDVLRYLELLFTLGDDFDRGGRFPEIEAIFRSTKYRPEVKIDLATQLAMPEPAVPAELEAEAGETPAEEEFIGFEVGDPEPGADPGLPEPYDGDLPPDDEVEPSTPVPDSLREDPHYQW
jgi:hypothetical protein